MTNRDIVSEISSINSRRGRETSIALFHKHELTEILKRATREHDPILNLIPIRAVTFIEVFFRASVAEFIDAGPPYTERAEKFFSAKANFQTAFALYGQKITIGQLIAHTLPLNRLNDIDGVLDTLLDLKFFDTVSYVHDRVEVEIHGKPPEPILGTKASWYPVIQNLFETRHRVVHEASSKDRISRADAEEYAEVTGRFLRASWEMLTNILHPNYPLTQMDMNIEAGKSFKSADDDLQDIVAKIEFEIQKYPKYADRELKVFRETNSHFESYRQAQMIFSHDPEGGGSIGPTVRAGEGESLTRERIKRLTSWLNERSNR